MLLDFSMFLFYFSNTILLEFFFFDIKFYNSLLIAIPMIWKGSPNSRADFDQLSIIFLWLSDMYFHGACFFNYEAWLSDPTHIGPSAQVVWLIVGQEILNGDVGGGF